MRLLSQLLCASYTTSPTGHCLVAPAASVLETLPDADIPRASDTVLPVPLVTNPIPHASDTVPPVPLVANPPGDAILSRSVDIVLSLVKPASVTANKRKRAAAASTAEQKFGPVEVDLSSSFDSAWATLAELVDQSAEFFDITSAEWRFMKPANSPMYPLRDAKAFLFLAKQVHIRATARTPKDTDILVRVSPQPVQVRVSIISMFFLI